MAARKTTKKAPAKKTAAKKTAAKKTAETPLQKAKRLAAEAEEKAAELEKAAAEAEAKAAELEQKNTELEQSLPEEDVQITIKHGISRSHQMSVPASTTIGQIIQEPDLRAVLAYGENVKAIVNGCTISETEKVSALGENPVINIESQSNSKA